MILAAALLAAMSCNKELGESYSSAKDEKIEVGVHLNIPETKATNIKPENEKKVNSVQIYVFRDNGELESYDQSNNGDITLSVTKGNKDFYALVNAPAHKYDTKDALLADISYLKNNTLSSFEMIGSKSINITGNQTIEIVVKRLVAKVELKKISRKFISASQGAVEMSIDAIYLTNVAGDTEYQEDTTKIKSTPSIWLNQMGYHSSEADSLLYDGSISQTLADKSEYSVVHSFYPYRNPTTDNKDGGEWSPRHTKLVIKTTYGGKVKYYPIVLPKLERNKKYVITDLILTRPGSDSEDIPVSAADCKFSIKVAEWEDGKTYTETI